MSLDIEDTIVAIASAPGAAMRGIVRISGPSTLQCLSAVFEPEDGNRIADCQSTTALSGTISLDPSDHCDRIELACDVLVWPTNKSYTRQPTAEIHTIGSTPILQSVLSKICGSGARLANPGEFTLRAFLSGRIDMTQAEAVLAVIDSTGESQMKTALRQLAGGLAGPLGKVRDQLMATLAELEAGLDFVEEDIEFISKEELADQLIAAQTSLEKVSEQICDREMTADSAKVVLYGLPNSGKSSLFNALTQSDQAIVTDIAGTTTDFVSGRMKIGNVAIELIDTAGFEKPNELIAAKSQEHRKEQQEQAVVRLLCIDPSTEVSEWELEELDRIQSDQNDSNSTIVILTKSDLQFSIPQTLNQSPVILTSSVDATGLAELCDRVSLAIMDSYSSDNQVVSSTVLRASESLRAAQQSVDFALDAAKNGLGEELVAAEIRQALEGLGTVVGTVYTDDILDLVFGKFCIGK